jgi:ribonuclease E
MTRKKLGMGLLETFSEACEACAGRGVVVHHEPHMKARSGGGDQQQQPKGEKSGKQRHKNQNQQQQQPKQEVAKVVTAESAVQINSLVAQIAAASAPSLESLTESLPEPTAPGQGRRKSRRVTSEVQVPPSENE